MPPQKKKPVSTKVQAPKKDSGGSVPSPYALGGGVLGLMLLGMIASRFFKPRTPKDWADPAPLPAEGRLGTFKLGPMIADGGMATVYMGKDEQHSPVAIKIPHRGPLRSASFVKTFEREAQIGVDLRHPSIVRVLQAGTYKAPGLKRVPYFVMEYLEGQELDGILRLGPLPEKEAINVARGVADALQWAHARGVIHRDISPRNIFVTSRKGVKVMDFGISAVNTRGARGPRARGLAYGTPEYLAPERMADFGVADERSDLYSLGCVLYEMLAGRPPFQADTPEKTLLAHRKTPVPSLFDQGLASRPLDEVVMKLLAKDPKHRFQTAGEVTSKLADLRPVV